MDSFPRHHIEPGASTGSRRVEGGKKIAFVPPPVRDTIVTMDIKESVIVRSQDVLGGTPVFCRTRVPFQTLIDYLEGGHPLAEFLADFPTVTREQAVAALEQAKDLVLARV